MVEWCKTLLLFGLVTCASTTQPTAQIGQGALTGLYMQTINNRLVAAFLGIPYAKPPVGKYRFKESVPASPWIGVYNASSYSEECYQYSHLTYHTSQITHGSEDCLYVNVFTPKVSPGTGGLGLFDVVVHIHGGAFMFYSSSSYGPEYLLDKDVVLVTFNYRLGPLGFLSTQDNILPGNNGMKDQVLALKWIKNNIAAFGGDPNSIILTGLSAGGTSVHYHMLSPLSQGLFHKAVALGGSAFCPWSLTENPKQKTMKIANYLGCPTNDSNLTLKCLRTRPVNQIVSATKILQPWLYYPFSPFGVVIEPVGPSAFIAEAPIDTILQKKANDIPILFTMNADEGLYPGAEILSDPALTEELNAKWIEYVPHLLDYNYTAPAGQLEAISQKIWQFYMGNTPICDAKTQFIKMIGDRLFYHGIIKAAKLHAELYNSPVYSYLFSHKGSASLTDAFNCREIYNGAAHSDDMFYLIKNKSFRIDNDSNDLQLSKRMVDYLLTFIKGAPMPKGWPTVKVNLPNFTYLEIQNTDEINDVVRIAADYGNEKFWDSLNLKENIPTRIGLHEEL